VNPRDYIKQNEGLRLKPYLCTSGKLTIGYGRNLTARGISRQEAEHLFEDDYFAAESAVRDLVPSVDYISDNRRAALIDLAFNLGKMGLQGFKKMLEAVRRDDWAGAARELEDSFYFRQVPNRAERNKEMLLNG